MLSTAAVPDFEPARSVDADVAAVWEQLTVGPELAQQLVSLHGPVLLVDDLIDSRWTMTVAARALRLAGAEAVLPLALAQAG